MIFTGRSEKRDHLDCQFCGYQTAVKQNSRDIPSMRCPQKDCGKSSEDVRS